MAAASLQKSFDEIADQFSAEHPNITIDFNYAGSSSLVQNLEAGAPADVFASADEANMDDAQAAGLIETRTRSFAANKLVGVVPIDNPADVSTLEEANADDVKLCYLRAPSSCGALSQDLAESAGITLDAVSEEQQVSDVWEKSAQDKQMPGWSMQLMLLWHLTNSACSK